MDKNENCTKLHKIEKLKLKLDKLRDRTELRNRIKNEKGEKIETKIDKIGQS